MFELIKVLFKSMVEKHGMLGLQLAIFSCMIYGAFYFGVQTKDFVDAQKATAASIDELIKTVSNLNKDRWAYQMHREYNEELFKLNEGKVKVPVVSEIREKHTN